VTALQAKRDYDLLFRRLGQPQLNQANVTRNLAADFAFGAKILAQKISQGRGYMELPPRWVLRLFVGDLETIARIPLPDLRDERHRVHFGHRFGPNVQLGGLRPHAQRPGIRWRWRSPKKS